MRLIDADKLISNLGSLVESGMTGNKGKAWLKFAIQIADAQPTVDAVEIVRCKDCINFYDKDNEGWGRCRERDSFGENGGLWHEESFCDWAEPIEEIDDERNKSD